MVSGHTSSSQWESRTQVFSRAVSSPPHHLYTFLWDGGTTFNGQTFKALVCGFRYAALRLKLEAGWGLGNVARLEFLVLCFFVCIFAGDV